MKYGTAVFVALTGFVLLALDGLAVGESPTAQLLGFAFLFSGLVSLLVLHGRGRTGGASKDLPQQRR